MRKNRGRPKAFDEDEVLLLAMNYFWEHGYDSASLDNLLEAMQIKKSSFYATFKSKEVLFSKALTLYRHSSVKYIHSLEKEKGSRETLLIIMHTSINELRERGSIRGCLLINSAKECYHKYGNLSTQITNEYIFFLDMFSDLIAHAKEKGEIKSTIDTRLLAGRFSNAINGLMSTIEVGASDEIIDDIIKSIEELLT